MLTASTNFTAQHDLDYKTPVYLVHFDGEIDDFTNMQLPAVPSNNNLAGYWPLDETSGTTVEDLSGNGNDGAITGDPQFVSGISGNALEMDSVTDLVTVPDDSSLKPGSGSFSVSFWFKAGTGLVKWPMGKGNPYSATGPGWGLSPWSSADPIPAIKLYISDGTIWPYDDVFTNLDRSQWYHLCFVVDREDDMVYGYKDGVIDTSFSITGLGSVDSTMDLWFNSGHASTNQSNLTFDEIRIYNRKLSPAEVRALSIFVRPSNSYLESITGLDRMVTPDQGSGSIGGVKIRLLDYSDAITTLLSTDSVYFHRKKTTIKAGYLGMTEADMLTIFTGWITGLKLSSDGLYYDIDVTDPQKWMQRKVFRGSETSTVTLSGNPINILLAILLSTGAGTNGTHDYLSEENGLGIDTDHIAVSGIESVRDKYFPGTSHKMEFSIKKRLKAKDFIEKEILKPLNLYPVVDGQGRYSIKPSKPPIEALDTVQSFNEDNTIGLPTWDMNLAQTINEVEFHYDWDSVNDEFDSEVFYIDSTSLNARGPGKGLKIESKGLKTADGAVDIISRRKGAVFNRYSTPPIKITAKCWFTQLLSEPGDIVPFTHKLLPDLSDGTRGLSLERMEIIKIGVDWKNGVCKVDFLQTGFDKGTYGVITPTMTVTAAASGTQFTVSTVDATKFSKFTLPEIQLLNKNMRQKVNGKTLLTVNTSTGVCTCDDLGETPVVGDIISFSDYDQATTEQKRWGYIADSSNKLGAADDDAHLIIP